MKAPHQDWDTLERLAALLELRPPGDPQRKWGMWCLGLACGLAEAKGVTAPVYLLESAAACQSQDECLGLCERVTDWAEVMAEDARRAEASG